jgi:hypothetical protein
MPLSEKNLYVEVLVLEQSQHKSRSTRDSRCQLWHKCKTQLEFTTFQLRCELAYEMRKTLLKMAKIPNSDQPQGGIRSLGRVSIPCRPVTLAVGLVSRSWMRSSPPSKSVCQERSSHWYEKCQTTYGSAKVCKCRFDHCNDHITCEMLTSSKAVEIPVASTC